jgi:hypothetical protein
MNAETKISTVLQFVFRLQLVRFLLTRTCAISVHCTQSYQSCSTGQYTGSPCDMLQYVLPIIKSNVQSHNTSYHNLGAYSLLVSFASIHCLETLSKSRLYHLNMISQPSTPSCPCSESLLHDNHNAILIHLGCLMMSASMLQALQCNTSPRVHPPNYAPTLLRRHRYLDIVGGHMPLSHASCSYCSKDVSY